ncbi:MAG TPA: HAD family hydrolase [Chthoniobacterales bacterium]|nr:HAD family hydrolase [Chthoniobacterales bacterium]
MKYRALACDYDGTLAHDGLLNAATAAALDRFRASGRELIMVTGRELPDLKTVCHVLDRFEYVVAENGALLYYPEEDCARLLCAPASSELVAALRAANVRPMSVGQAIIATVEPNELIVIEEIKRLGLELQVIFNKGSVMVLPTGVNKATGLGIALKEMAITANEVVGIGDAENDHAFLGMCAIGVAVDNALSTLKERADFVTSGAQGAGVIELIDMMLVTDLSEIVPRPREPQPATTSS